MRYRGKLGDSEFKELSGLQREIRESGSEGSTELPFVRTRRNIVDQAIGGLGHDPNADEEDTDEGKTVRAFRRRVDQELTRIQQSEGRKPTKGEVQEVTDRLTTEIVEGEAKLTGEGGFLGGLGDALEVTVGYVPFVGGGSRGRAFETEIQGVPNEMVDELAYGVKQAGMEVTPENIRKLYNYRIQGRR
jgi:hypothetical protein